MYGWLTAKGFAETDLHQHLNAECVRQLIEGNKELDELEERADATDASCQEAADAGEHPEWHWYEMAYDDYICAVVRTCYDAGFIRVGTRGDEIHFEYKGELGARVDRCNSLADSFEMKPVFTRRGVYGN